MRLGSSHGFWPVFEYTEWVLLAAGSRAKVLCMYDDHSRQQKGINHSAFFKLCPEWDRRPHWALVMFSSAGLPQGPRHTYNCGLETCGTLHVMTTCGSRARTTYEHRGTKCVPQRRQRETRDQGPLVRVTPDGVRMSSAADLWEVLMGQDSHQASVLASPPDRASQASSALRVISTEKDAWDVLV